MSKVLDTTWSLLQRRRNYEIVDDGDDATSGGKWTNTNTGGGSAVAKPWPIESVSVTKGIRCRLAPLPWR